MVEVPGPLRHDVPPIPARKASVWRTPVRAAAKKKQREEERAEQWLHHIANAVGLVAVVLGAVTVICLIAGIAGVLGEMRRY